MTARTARPKIDRNARTGEARCPHRNLFGSVCAECFAVTPWLIDSYETVYHMDGTEFTDMLDGGRHGDAVKVSPTTPAVVVIPVEQVRTGDRLLGFTGRASRPLVVGDIVSAAAFDLVYVRPDGRRVRIQEGAVAVLADRPAA